MNDTTAPPESAAPPAQTTYRYRAFKIGEANEVLDGDFVVIWDTLDDPFENSQDILQQPVPTEGKVLELISFTFGELHAHAQEEKAGKKICAPNVLLAPTLLEDDTIRRTILPTLGRNAK